MSRPKHSDSGRARREQVDLEHEDETRFQTDRRYRDRVIAEINDRFGFSSSDADPDRRPLDETYFGLRDRYRGELSHPRPRGSMHNPRSMESVLHILRGDTHISPREEEIMMAGYRRAHIDYLNFHGLFLDENDEEIDEQDSSSLRSAYTRCGSVTSDRSESGSTRSFYRGYSRPTSVYSKRSASGSTSGSPHRHSRRESGHSDEKSAESRPGSPSSARSILRFSSRDVSPAPLVESSARGSRRPTPAHSHPQGSTTSTSHRGRSRTTEKSGRTSSKSLRKSPSVKEAESTVKMLKGFIRNSKSKALEEPSCRYPSLD